MKKLNIAVLILFISALFGNALTTSASDISGHGHETGLRYLIAKGALDSDSKGNYNPNKIVTRGEFSAYVSRVLKLPQEGIILFSDVPSSYKYADDIQRAAAAGIITGYIDDRTFKPNNPITRQHMAIILDRVMDYLELKKPGGSFEFTDSHLISEPYREAVVNGAVLGIIQGNNGNFMPQKNATIAQSSTFIHRLMKVSGDPDAHIQLYTVKEISNGALSGNLTFYSYKDAEKAVTKTSQVITLGDNIVKMSSGYAVTNKYVALASQTINDQISVAANTEMEYLSSEENKVKVRLAGHIGYLNQKDLDLIPFSMSEGRSYYTNENGEIKHVLFDHVKGKYTASYVYGKAPAFMKPGAQYYSWNGINFNSASGASAGEAFNYYQFLPARTKSTYSAEEIDRYIIKRLTELEKSGSIVYAKASEKSKLIGLGTTLKAIEEKYNINAMLILSLAQHESAYGMSVQAQTLNNLFGLYVYDTNPLNKNFASVADNINELITKFLEPNYISPKGPYAHGAAVGSKQLGFNVKYASDPFWGAKIAGHYYRAEKDMGQKDAKANYMIGLTSTTGLNVRTVAGTVNNNPLFSYKRQGVPVLINKPTVNGWYEITSDLPYKNPVYVSKDYVRVIQTVK
ncbi:S-layer homology domain-containing protein [Sporosarcina sp.]|uniref:S-layer homology domain-containing protein n=1 Tax=Sporosarcina sp. TaxID=49982 RepID=UPI00260D1866|nr:S-layer homology domain-containing protein [Sporosarcina sp.]